MLGVLTTAIILKTLKINNVTHFDSIPVKFRVALTFICTSLWPPGALILAMYGLGSIIKCLTDIRCAHEPFQECLLSRIFASTTVGSKHASIYTKKKNLEGRLK